MLGSNIKAWGEVKSLLAWSKDSRIKCSRATVLRRIEKGWEPEKAFTTSPKRKICNKYTYNGITQSLLLWAKDSRCKISHGVLKGRLKKGWPLEKALLTDPWPFYLPQYQIGSKFGKLTVIEILPLVNKDGRVKCKCDCGNIIETYGKDLGKRVKSCGCIVNESAKKRESEKRKKRGFVTYDTIYDKLYGKFLWGANNRGLEVNISKEDYCRLICNECFYCDKIGSNNVLKGQLGPTFKGVRFNGIDRLDNNKGYLKGNCVTCCCNCNAMKMDKSKEEFLDYILKIYNKHFLNIRDSQLENNKYCNGERNNWIIGTYLG